MTPTPKMEPLAPAASKGSFRRLHIRIYEPKNGTQPPPAPFDALGNS
jgi:hypothetical protein